MTTLTRLLWAPDEKGAPRPDEDLPLGQSGHVVYNQDGTRLGSWEGGSVANPTGGGIGDKRVHGEYVHAAPDHLTIGADDTVLPDDGQRRTVHPGVAGAPSENDYQASGYPGGDPSNIGIRGDNQYGE